jgi:cyclophilin family peptidyl-prolyl cis-trans isomerase
VVNQYDAPPEMAIDTDASYSAVISTNHGDITATLYASGSPATVNNFVFLANDGFYDGSIFHRVIPGFMIQGGDAFGASKGRPGTGDAGYKFNDEPAKAKSHGYPRGTMAMANSGPNTNGCQFFVMHADYALPPAYTVFGMATDGLDVVDAIAKVRTAAGDKPVEDVIISSVKITQA